MSVWKYLPAQLAHDWSTAGLTLYAALCEETPAQWNSFEWRGLHFRNRLGTAGGVDKNAEQIFQWQHLGAGFVEVGTVTPAPQLANAGKILARNWPQKNLWNKMGFPSEGCRQVLIELAKAKGARKIPVFLNVGKNRVTKNEKALEDYLEVIKTCHEYADAIVLNVSSPNTQGLRELQNEKYLSEMVRAVTHATAKPVLVKFSPDMTPNELEISLGSALSAGAAGFILTNTTTFRPEGCGFAKEGGLSGQGLKSLSLQALRHCTKMLGAAKKDTLLVSVGGVLSPTDIEERLSLGADLVQIYSALVFEGPHFFKKAALHFNKGGLSD